MDKCCRNCHYFVNGCCERERNFEVLWSEDLNTFTEGYGYVLDSRDFVVTIEEPSDFCCNRWE